MLIRMILTNLRETTFIAGDSVLRGGRNRPYKETNSYLKTCLQERIS